ncbi:hypothetical protein JCM3765_007598, partial [Sporobolomyces pararoseus]
MSTSSQQMNPPSVAASQRTVQLFGFVNRLKRRKPISHEEKRLLQRIDNSLRTLIRGGWSVLDRLNYPNSRTTYPEQLRLSLEKVEHDGSEESWQTLKAVFDAFSAEAGFQRLLIRLREYIERLPTYSSMPKTSCLKDALRSLSTDQIRVLHRHNLEVDGEVLTTAQQLLSDFDTLGQLRKNHDALMVKQGIPREVKSEKMIENMRDVDSLVDTISALCRNTLGQQWVN